LVGFLQEKSVIIYVLPFGVSQVADMKKDETVAEDEVVEGDKRMVGGLFVIKILLHI